jgi:hypothetical protein
LNPAPPQSEAGPGVVARALINNARRSAEPGGRFDGPPRCKEDQLRALRRY